MQSLILKSAQYRATNDDATTSLTAFSFLHSQLRDNLSNREMILILPLIDARQMQGMQDKNFMCVFHCVLTISVQVVSLIGPASGLGRVTGGHRVASAVLSKEVSQSEGFPLLILLLS